MAIPKHRLPAWVQDWLDVIVPGSQILGILLVAYLLQRVLRRLVRKAAVRYQLPGELVVPINGLIRWTIMASALLLSLERLGVSAAVLWTAFTGFATVGAVAFFAAWSVLSNLFCALLIFTARPFRIGDHVEILDTAEKPGAKGRWQPNVDSASRRLALLPETLPQPWDELMLQPAYMQALDLLP